MVLIDGQKINMGYTYPISLQNIAKNSTNILRNKVLQFTSITQHDNKLDIKGNEKKTTYAHTLPRKKIRRLKQAITRKMLGKRVIE